MKGSGKQVLVRVLQSLSLRDTTEEGKQSNRRLRGGLLLHGSTATDSYQHASNLKWSAETDEDDVTRQGMATQSGVFLADIFETIVEMDGLKDFVLREYPQLDDAEWDAAEWGIFQVLSAIQYFSHLANQEATGDELEVADWIEYIMKSYDHWEDSQDGPEQG